jgi:hypothetical protein
VAGSDEQRHVVTKADQPLSLQHVLDHARLSRPLRIRAVFQGTPNAERLHVRKEHEPGFPDVRIVSPSPSRRRGDLRDRPAETTRLAQEARGGRWRLSMSISGAIGNQRYTLHALTPVRWEQRPSLVATSGGHSRLSTRRPVPRDAGRRLPRCP